MANFRIFSVAFGVFLLGLAPCSLGASEGPKSIRDVMRDASPGGKGIEDAYVRTGRLHHSMQHLEVSKSAKNARLFMDEAIKEVDFDMVFETPIAYDLGPNTKLFSILGGQRGEMYRVDYRRGPVSSKDLSGPLSFATGITFKSVEDPVPDESRGIGIGAKWYVNTGEMSHRTVGRYLGGVLRLAQTQAYNGQAGDLAKERGERLLDDFRKTFPRLLDFFERYVTTTPSLAADRKGGNSWSRAAATFVLKVESLKRDYPNFGAYVEGLIEALELTAKIVYRLPTGEEYATILVNGPKRLLSLECMTDSGRLIPQKADGSPYLRGAFDPATVTHHQAEIVVKFSAQLLGLRVDGKDITIGLKFDGTDAEAKLASRLQSAPTPKISGAFVGVLPPWAIDVLIPGTMEGYAKTFFTGLMKSKGGQGSLLTSDIKTQGSTYVFSNTFGTALVENSFLLIGLRMIQKHLWPDDRVMDDIGKIAIEGVGRFHADVRTLRHANLSL